MTVEEERVVLGSMMLDGSLVDEVAAVVSGPDYADPRHERIHDVIVRLQRDGHPTGPVAVADVLGDDLRRLGGAAALHEMVGEVAVASSATYYAERVRAAAMRRKVQEAGVRLQQIAEDGWDALEVVNSARSELDDLMAIDEPETNEVALLRAVESLDEPVGMPTPWQQLDRCVGGWAPGWLYVVGARPGVGKTVLGLAALLDCARRHKAAVMASCEMPKNDLYLRMLSSTGTVSGERMLHRTLSDRDWERLAVAQKAIGALPLIVDDTSGISIAQLRALVQAALKKGPVGLVVVDYLQLVRPPADVPKHDRRVQVDAVSMGLKDMARDFGVPVLALAQLSRAPEVRADKTPTLSDLRESGGIEQAADVVAMLHREPDAKDEMQVHIVKNRHGIVAKFVLGFEGKYARLTDMGYQPQGFGAPT